jgi:hypothetical protein
VVATRNAGAYTRCPSIQSHRRLGHQFATRPAACGSGGGRTCCMRRYEGGQRVRRWSPPDFESPGGSCSFFHFFDFMEKAKQHLICTFHRLSVFGLASSRLRILVLTDTNLWKRTYEIDYFRTIWCVCSVYYQPNSSRRGGPLSRPPAGCALGSVGNPFDRVWPPTTSGHLQPIFSCVDSRGTHPLCVYVREYGTHTHVVCTWVCVG